MVVTELRARYSETDQMGVIHHRHYLSWFELGRTDCIRQFGYTYRQLEEKGFLLPVIGARVNYHTPARYDDFICLKTSVSEYNGVRLSFQYRAERKGDGRLLASGETKHCWTNGALRPRSLKKSWPELDAVIQKMAEGG